MGRASSATAMAPDPRTRRRKFQAAPRPHPYPSILVYIRFPYAFHTHSISPESRKPLIPLALIRRPKMPALRHHRPSTRQAANASPAARIRTQPRRRQIDLADVAKLIGLAIGASPIQPRPSATRPSRTSRTSGMPSSSRRDPAARRVRERRQHAAGRDRVLELPRRRRADDGDRLSGRRSRAARRRSPPPRSARASARARPRSASPRTSRPTGSSRPPAARFSASVRRLISTAPSSPVPRSTSSSSSGSFISQCASRRSSSSCGPPPSKPRLQSQAWSEPSTAIRPSPCRSSTRSGRPSGPSITASPERRLDLDHAEPAAPARRAVGRRSAAARAPRAPAVTGWRCPISEIFGTKPSSITRAVGIDRQDLAQRRAVEALRPGEVRAGGDQQRAAVAHVAGDVLEVVVRQDAAALVAVEDDQVELVDLLHEQLLRREGDQRELEDRHEVLLLRRAQDGEVHEVDGAVGLQQVPPGPLARIGLAGDEQHPQPVAHAVDRDDRRRCCGR